MASILSGRLALSKIPADLIRYDNNGNAFVWVDVGERREPSQYGDTHYVSVYDRQNNQKIYLGDLRPRELGTSSADNAQRPSAFPPQRPACAPAAPSPAIAPRPAVPAAMPTNISTASPFAHHRDDSLEPQPDDLPFD